MIRREENTASSRIHFTQPYVQLGSCQGHGSDRYLVGYIYPRGWFRKCPVNKQTNKARQAPIWRQKSVDELNAIYHIHASHMCVYRRHSYVRWCDSHVMWFNNTQHVMRSLAVCGKLARGKYNPAMYRLIWTIYRTRRGGRLDINGKWYCQTNQFGIQIRAIYLSYF